MSNFTYYHQDRKQNDSETPFRPKPSAKVLAQYTIPLGANEATLVFSGERLSLDDFDALIDFVEFSKKQFERAEKRARKALWHSPDGDCVVTLTGQVSADDSESGEPAYRTTDGIEVPASQLEFP